MKEAEIWQQEHHEVIWQTAVQTKIWRGRVKGGEEKVLKCNGKFTGGGKKKEAGNNFLSEELSMFYFKAKKLHCGLYNVYSSQTKEKGLTGLHLEVPSTLSAAWKHREWGCSALHMCLLKQFDIQQWRDSSCYWSYSVQVTLWNLVVSSSGMAPKCTALMLWSPYIFSLESAMSIILDRIFLLKQESWLATLTRWAEGVSGLITPFLGSLKSRGKLEKRDWRKANPICVKGK